MSDESADSLVLRPASGRSDDALVLANYSYEQAHPAAASVQFVPKPNVQLQRLKGHGENQRLECCS